jgi:hypothetical protein
MIIPADQAIDLANLNDGKPRAIIRSASKRTKNVQEPTPPPPELNLPALWIKGNDGTVHLLETPMSETIPTNLKSKKNHRKVDLSLGSKSPKKPSSPTAYTTLTIDEGLFSQALLQGVKITCEIDTDITQMKDEDLQQTLLQQQMSVQKEPPKPILPVKKYEEVKREERKKPIMKRRPIVRNKGKFSTKDEYLFHIPHPNIMCPLFELAPLGQILYGPYEKDVEVIERQVWQNVCYKGPEKFIFALS